MATAQTEVTVRDAPASAVRGGGRLFLIVLVILALAGTAVGMQLSRSSAGHDRTAAPAEPVYLHGRNLRGLDPIATVYLHGRNLRGLDPIAPVYLHGRNLRGLDPLLTD